VTWHFGNSEEKLSRCWAEGFSKADLAPYFGLNSISAVVFLTVLPVYIFGPAIIALKARVFLTSDSAPRSFVMQRFSHAAGSWIVAGISIVMHWDSSTVRGYNVCAAKRQTLCGLVSSTRGELDGGGYRAFR
jgi:hypothetical protein